MGNNIKKSMTLLLAPQELTLYGKGFNTARPMPLAIGVLQGAVRNAGHSISSFDLSTVLQHEKQPDAWEALYDVDGVLQSLRQGGEGPLCEPDGSAAERHGRGFLRCRGDIHWREQFHF